MNYLKLKSGQGMPQLEIFQQFTIAYRVNSKVPSLLLKTLSSFPQRLSQHILCLVPSSHCRPHSHPVKQAPLCPSPG